MRRAAGRLDLRDAGLFLAALLTRTAYAWRQGLALPLTGDAYEYSEFARNLAQSGAYVGPDGALATRMPGYPVFLALLRFVAGPSPYAVIAVQCALGALTCVLLYRLARRLLPEAWALICGGAAALYFDLIAPAALPLSESVYSFMLVLAAWALYKEDWSPRVRALLFGVFSGVLYLVRPEPLPSILVTCALLPSLFPGFGRKEVGLALAGAALILSLWTGRNYARFHRLLPGSSISKSVVYISLYLPAARAGLEPVRFYASPSLPELEQDAAYLVEFKKLFSRLTPVQLARAYLFNFVSILYPFLPAYDWSYMAVLPFALLGLAAAFRRKELWPISLPVVFSIGIFTFCGGWASRYRQGVSPFIVLLGAAGLQSIERRLGFRRLLWTAGTWLGTNIMIWAFQSEFRQLALRLRDFAWGH